MIQAPIPVLAVLLGVLAGLFAFAQHPAGQRCFKIVPLLVFAYFVPMALSNCGVIPTESRLYEFIKDWLLPASLLLLTMSVDVPAVLRLGPTLLALFLAGTATIVLGGPLAYLALRGLVPVEMGDQAWKGLAALSGSWIGGGANFVAIGESVGATDSTLAMMVVVDVALANTWMTALLFFAANDEKLDARIGADRRSLDDLRQKSEAFQRQVARPPMLGDLFAILFLAFGATALAAAAAPAIAAAIARLAPDAAGILGEFAWKVVLVTAIGVGVSFTPLRRLDGAGAGRIGSVMLFLLVASIGAKAQLAKVLEVPGLFVVAAAWIGLHAATLLLLRRRLKATIFSMAVGSQANIGGAASAPIVAGAFHPALAPVGALMGVTGYVLGTPAGLACAFLMRWVYGLG